MHGVDREGLMVRVVQIYAQQLFVDGCSTLIRTRATSSCRSRTGAPRRCCSILG